MAFNLRASSVRWHWLRQSSKVSMAHSRSISLF
jgi:hypothetical protein